MDVLKMVRQSLGISEKQTEIKIFTCLPSRPKKTNKLQNISHPPKRWSWDGRLRGQRLLHHISPAGRGPLWCSFDETPPVRIRSGPASDPHAFDPAGAHNWHVYRPTSFYSSLHFCFSLLPHFEVCWWLTGSAWALRFPGAGMTSWRQGELSAGGNDPPGSPALKFNRCNMDFKCNFSGTNIQTDAWMWPALFNQDSLVHFQQKTASWGSVLDMCILIG